MDIDAHDVKSECDMKIAPFKRVLWFVEGGAMKIAPFKRVLWLVGRGASCMKILPFEEYFG
jgi:hypothetical protein